MSAKDGAKAVTLAEVKNSSIIREYRIALPLSVEEYHIGQLYGVAEASKNETGGGDGIEVIENRPIAIGEPFFEEGKGLGQYTHKRFYLSSKVPRIVRAIAPANSLEIDEKAWNCYPYCRTEYSNRYMNTAFHIIIETRHEPGIGDIQNVHNLNQQELIKRTIERIDIANDVCDPKDYKLTEDPKRFKSATTGRGPLAATNWEKQQSPVMTCYKLYRVLFQWRLLQTKVENLIMRSVRRLLFNFHRQVFCWLDKWSQMTIADIRELELKTKSDLEELRSKGEVRGMSGED